MAVTRDEVLEKIHHELESIKVPNAREATPDHTWAGLDVDTPELV